MNQRRLPAAAVLDTSVLLRLFHDHDDDLQSRAEALRDAFLERTFDPVLLDLSIYELINVLVRRIGRDARRVTRDVEALFELGLPVYPIDRELATLTATIAARTGLSGYDAAFVAGSEVLRLPLITSDTEIGQRSRGYEVIDLRDLPGGRLT